jgi:hypothetical protein
VAVAKSEVYFSLDIEASGPVPGPWWMCSFGVCRTDDVSVGILRELKPLVLPGISRPDVPASMDVVGQGLPREVTLGAADRDERVARVRAYYEQQGLEPRQALEDLRDWLAAHTGPRERSILIAGPATFDFMWIYWYWWQLLEEMPPFGFSGLDLRSYFMGSHGVGFLGTGKRRYLKHYPNQLPHTHDPLDDARQQGQIWQDMLIDREQRPHDFPGKRGG